jgi:hypothetical protein
MKLKKLLQKLEKFLVAKERARTKQMKSMHEVLNALKQEERRLKARAKAEKAADARASLEKKRDVVHAQRKKGLIALKALQKS